jgi:alkylation response protein AidB-like acyl-CoA dehydrogenase
MLDFSITEERERVRVMARRLCETGTLPRELFREWSTLDAANASKAKLIASETALRANENAIRIHGGAGIMRDYPVGRYHRDALVYVIGERTSEIERNIIARGPGL